MSEKSPGKKLLIAGGGTGGHVLAGIAIADEWKQTIPDSKILFVGSEQGLESRLVPKHGYSLVTLKIGALNRVSLKTRLLTMMKLPLSFLKAMWILISFRPDAVIGVGGYASGPVVMLARIMAPFCGILTAILEQNSVAGFTNRVLGKWVHRVFCAFEDGSIQFSKNKVLITGNPIRSHLQKLPPSKEEPFTLFIFGGSQGASGINSMVIDALPFLKKENVEFIHQTGVNDFERVKAAYAREGIQNVRIEKFIDDMASCYEKASLVICRAGASTLTELASVGRAAIFIPLPTAADNHQEKNARIFEKTGAAMVIPQGSMTGAQFSEQILALKKDRKRIHSIEEKVRPFYRGDSARLIVQGLVRA
jgi:UDP-N-acetylglucosamine--N-acetylmuramyl-(pentapeptide) pyrophosphoryl-undecaprenol N-acetylglucosamine transferase